MDTARLAVPLQELSWGQGADLAPEMFLTALLIEQNIATSPMCKNKELSKPAMAITYWVGSSKDLPKPHISEEPPTCSIFYNT